jgi:hypothetical protein
MVVSRQHVVLEVIKELIWIGISVLMALAIMSPITSKVHYNMVWLNGLFLVIAFTYFRYAVMLRSVFVLRSRWVRFVLFFFNINFFIFVLRQQQHFITIYDSFTIEDMGVPIRPLPLEQIDKLFRYFFTESTFTVVACLGMVAALSVRFIFAYWHTAHIRLNAGEEE